jgi:hypothetical protein
MQLKPYTKSKRGAVNINYIIYDLTYGNKKREINKGTKASSQNSEYYISFNAAMPGSILPSRYSREAPPPVET